MIQGNIYNKLKFIIFIIFFFFFRKSESTYGYLFDYNPCKISRNIIKIYLFVKKFIKKKGSPLPSCGVNYFFI
jgi:hypothetical protein